MNREGVPVTNPNAAGLLVFVAVVCLNVAGLGLDLALEKSGVDTITSFARRNQWVACIVLLVNVAGLVGLMVHFTDWGQKQ